VKATYPGASSEVLVETVASPIEQEVNGVEDMLYMSSKSASSGNMDLTITFEVGTDVDMAAVLTQNRVAIAEPSLPQEVRQQGITTKKKSTAMVVVVSVFSPDGTYDELFMSNYVATQINDVIARVDGVGEVVVFGAKDFGMRIWLDPNLLKARGLTTDDVVAALREQNVQVAAGKLGERPNPAGLNFEYQLTTKGRLADVRDFERIIVKRGAEGQLVRLADVSRVELGAQTYAWYAELDGAPSISMGIYQLPGSNALGVAQGVQEAMQELSESFPQGMEWSIPYNATLYIQASIAEVVETLIVAIILVVFTVYIFMQDFRATLVPAITIPVSLIGTFAVMLVTGQSINNLTLFGLILAIGIVVDDAIVVVENATRLIDDEGLSPKEATSKAMDEIAGALVATTLVLLAVFAPTLVMPGLTGRLYRPFAITISVATVFSSINALTLSPALCGMVLRGTPTKQNWFFRKFNQFFDVTTNGYMRVVNMAVRRTLIAVVIFAVAVGGVIWGFGRMPGGFVPSEDEGYLFINVQLPDAASLDRTQEVMDQVNEIVMSAPGVQNTLVIGGFSLLDAVQGPNLGMGIATLQPWDERGPDLTMWDVMAYLQPRLSAIDEGIVFAFGPPPIQGLGAAGGFSMELQDRGGLGLQTLETFANDLVATGATNPVLTRMNQNFRGTVPQYFLNIDREKVKTLGIPLGGIFNTLQTNLGSAYVNDFNLFGRTWRVLAQADQEFRTRREDITRLEVPAPGGGTVPLSTLVEVEESVGPAMVSRFNMFPSASITGGPAPGFSDGQAVAEIERLASQSLPDGMGFEWSGVTQQQKAAGNVAPLIFSLALVMVFLFLAAQYESWGTPFSVLLAVPLAILGAVLATLSRSLDNNVYTQVGFVLLIGLSAKNAILIVEFAKQLYEEGTGLIEAATTSARLRFRPILMTAFSFILGVIPLVIATGAGANSRVSLGTAVLGGMLLVTIGGVFLTPVLYVLVQSIGEKLGGGKKAPVAPAPQPEG
jgi:HAE1 family hydrophobic/amphiphilic exporter-1